MRYLSIQSSLIISYIEHHSFCLHSAYTQNEKPLFTRLPAIFFLFKLNSHICPSSIFAGFYCSSDTKTKVLFYGIHMLFSDSITKRLPNDYQSRYWLPQESYAIIWSISMLIQRLVIPDLLNDCSHIACQVSHRLINVLIKLLLLLCSNINIRCKISNRRIFFWIHSTFVSK